MLSRVCGRAAAAALWGALLVHFPAAGQSCPSLISETVLVEPGDPTPFRLNGRNLDGEVISVFQYPNHGALVPDGSGIDFVYLPEPGFSGITSASFRSTKPGDCGGPTPTATMTFVVGGAAPVALSGDVGVRPIICGVDFVPVVLGVAAWAGCLTMRQRRRRG